VPTVTALLVEDSDEDVLMMRRLAQSSGLDVVLRVIRDGSGALEFLLDRAVQKRPDFPHLVLLDLSLPKMGGIEVLRRIKGESVLADIPVIILSGTEREDEIREGQTLRAHSHIAKPMSATEFGWIVRSVSGYWPRLEKLRAL